MEIAFLFAVIAMIYSSVGFGGGSSYLAILALYELPFKEMRLVALLCNIVVVTGGTYIFIRKKEIRFEKILPLIILSVPAAYAGATIRISEHVFFILLGATLSIAAAFLWISPVIKNNDSVAERKTSHFFNSATGGFIGLLSGMVGIGGGIFLSPLLNLIRWDAAKKIAATSSVFILVNSIAGVIGQLRHLPEEIHWRWVIVLLLAVAIGGQIGSRVGAHKLNEKLVRRVTAILVLFAGTEILYKHLAHL